MALSTVPEDRFLSKLRDWPVKNFTTPKLHFLNFTKSLPDTTCWSSGSHCPWGPCRTTCLATEKAMPQKQPKSKLGPRSCENKQIGWDASEVQATVLSLETEDKETLEK